ncbi:MAG: peptidoglycan-binding protein [Myxococcota bacterium]
MHARPLTPRLPTPIPSTSTTADAYTVRNGDTLWDIARAHGLELSEVVDANPQLKNPRHITPGMVLRLPHPAPAPEAAPAETTPAAPRPAGDRRTSGVENGGLGSGTLRARLESAVDGPAPTLAAVADGAKITRGQSGESVTDLQHRLTRLGYGVQASGTYGSTTEGVVKHFQRDHGLSPDGVFGRDSLRALERAERGEGAANRPFVYGGDSATALRQKHLGHADGFALHLSGPMQRDVQAFEAHYRANQARYQAVADRTNMPPELIAAIHWRESHGNFGTYLHQGDPLGRPAVHQPRNIPVFHRWEDAAVHALSMHRSAARALNLSSTSHDDAAMAAYAEMYNGLGYHYRGRPSPYVYSGTDQYTRGKYVADGVYRSNVVDQQVGVMALIRSLGA